MAKPSESSDDLRGLRVLVVEDHFLIADEVSWILTNCGCSVAGPVGRLQPALELASRTELDGAILDINLVSEFCFPLVEILRERRVPFFFLTGYENGGSVVPPAFRHVPQLTKPIVDDEIVTMAKDVFRRTRPA